MVGKVKKISLGTLLKENRESKKLSLRAVENVTGISNAYLSQLEGDKIKQPSPVVLHKLSEHYGVSYAEVMQLAGYPIPETNEHTSSFSARIGSTSKDEEDALVEYLEFLRSRRRTGGRR